MADRWIRFRSPRRVGPPPVVIRLAGRTVSVGSNVASSPASTGVASAAQQAGGSLRSTQMSKSSLGRSRRGMATTIACGFASAVQTRSSPSPVGSSKSRTGYIPPTSASYATPESGPKRQLPDSAGPKYTTTLSTKSTTGTSSGNPISAHNWVSAFEFVASAVTHVPPVDAPSTRTRWSTSCA